MNNILSKSTIDNLERMLISKKYSQLEKIIESYEKFNFNLPAVQMIYGHLSVWSQALQLKI